MRRALPYGREKAAEDDRRFRCGWFAVQDHDAITTMKASAQVR